MKNMEDYDKFQLEISTLKRVQISFNKQEMKEINVEIDKLKLEYDEILKDLNQIEVQKRLQEIYKTNFNLKDIESKEIEISSENMGWIIGKNHSGVILQSRIACIIGGGSECSNILQKKQANDKWKK